MPNPLIGATGIYQPTQPYYSADTVAAARDIRLAGPTTTPGTLSPTTGPHPLLVLLGNATLGDQSLKWYWWDSTSVAADNGTSVLQPGNGTSSPLATGRWRSP